MKERRVFDVVTNIVHPIFKKKGELLYFIVSNWDILVPTDLKDFTIPQKISWKENKATLVLYSYNKSAGPLILAKKQIIMEKINESMGHSYIKNIQITNKSI